MTRDAVNVPERVERSRPEWVSGYNYLAFYWSSVEQGEKRAFLVSC
jgi:hypothetical protein